MDQKLKKPESIMVVCVFAEKATQSHYIKDDYHDIEAVEVGITVRIMTEDRGSFSVVRVPKGVYRSEAMPYASGAYVGVNIKRQHREGEDAGQFHCNIDRMQLQWNDYAYAFRPYANASNDYENGILASDTAVEVLQDYVSAIRKLSSVVHGFSKVYPTAEEKAAEIDLILSTLATAYGIKRAILIRENKKVIRLHRDDEDYPLSAFAAVFVEAQLAIEECKAEMEAKYLAELPTYKALLSSPVDSPETADAPGE